MPHLPGYRLIAVDLPGQGFTKAGGLNRLGLDAMADDLLALLRDQNWRPIAIVGHSAGAAIALRMAEMMPMGPRAVIGINAALGPFHGFAGWLFPKLARAMSASPFVSAVVTRLSSKRKQVEKLLAATGSPLDAQGVELYQRLVSRMSHIDGTLGMMAQWNLEPLLERLPQITVPTLLIASDGDKAVPAVVSALAAARMPRAQFSELPNYGHLVHEENPALIAGLITPFLTAHAQALRVVG
jgi:magnesium chelatase accessory protein